MPHGRPDPDDRHAEDDDHAGGDPFLGGAGEALAHADAALDDSDVLAELDEDFPLGDGVAETETEVWCPYCGEPNEIALDPGGGTTQDYVEDCQVCCQPWRVFVTYLDDGSADVGVEPADGR